MTGQTPGVRFSIVSAVYDVARYLPDYIDSIERQTFPLDRMQVVAVDDGSHDDSLAVLRDWQQRRPGLVTVLTKENGGQGSARNLGTTHATGEWITYLDPDDRIEPDYLAAVDAALTEHPGVSLVATNRILLDDATGAQRDDHPLRRMFERDRVVDLDLAPEFFHGSAPAAFFRAAALREQGLQFDDRIRPNFEDGHFCARYLLHAGVSQVAFLKSARYLYRKRSDASSTLQTSLLDRRRYEVVPRHGYLALLRDSAPAGGHAPEWLQNFVLYELSFYFGAEAAMSASPTAARGEVGAAFVATLREIAAALDPRVVAGFAVRRFQPVWREILLRLGDEDRVADHAVATAYDKTKKLVRLNYWYRGDAPAEQIVSDGRVVPATFGKVRVHEYFGSVLMRERIVWVPARGAVRLLLDGVAIPIRGQWPEPDRTTVRPFTLRTWTGAARPAAKPLPAKDESLVRLARSRLVRRTFRNAWVIMDRIPAADDNGERLFRHLRDERKDINAWFVLDENSPDWRRLKADGYDHLVAHGSTRWKLLMLNCRHFVTSHTEAAVRKPAEILRLTDPTWTYTFLQHGVIKDDLSRWLNSKAIDVFVTSTQDEYDSIAGDGTGYVYTDKEVVLSGLPRFDRLRSLSRPVAERDLVLVCPTWRIWLSPRDADDQPRTVVDDFTDTEYARQWLGFLRDERLRDAVAAQGLRLGFLPHPNIQPVLASLDLPSWVEPLTYAGTDVQQLLARTAVMVTDYSSQAFNAGYLDAPVVYFQFDADTIFGGGHVGVKGYYDYVRDGFGPVTATLDETVAAVSGIVADPGRSAGPEYAERSARAFPQRDGRCCERVVAAIEQLDAKAPS